MNITNYYVKNKDDLLLLVDDLRILPFVKEVIR